MDGPDPIALTRVRLAALSQVIRAGGAPSAYDLARAIQPMLSLALDLGIEAGRWQATHAAELRRRAAAEAAVRAEYGPGSVEPGEPIGQPASPARRSRARVAPRL